MKNKFLLLFILVISIASSSLIYFGYAEIRSVFIETKNIVISQQNKRDLLTALRRSAKNRIETLKSMMIVEDDFDLDELHQEMGQDARNFITARGEYFKLNLTKKERAFMEKQRAISNIVAPLLNSNAEAILNGNKSAVYDQLFEQTIPKQNIMIAAIDGAINENKLATQAAVNRINKSINTTSNLLLLLMLLLAQIRI